MTHGTRSKIGASGSCLAAALVAVFALVAVPAARADEVGRETLLGQSADQAAARSSGCESCHVGIEPMHESTLVNPACIDCHGGRADVGRGSAEPGSDAYDAAKRAAHVQPSHPEAWSGSRNPEQSYTRWLKESPEYVRFVNPGDLRVAAESCGTVGCHGAGQGGDFIERSRKSIMATSALLWGGAAYNNGIVPLKRYVFGESYGRDGETQKILEKRELTEEQKQNGIMQALLPLPPWNIVQPPDPFRAFEKGGRVDRSVVSEVGNPNIGPFLDEPGKPDNKLSSRGLGTELRVNAGVLNIHKTRLNDPHLSFLGTNDHPGDYRSSGCTACHVVYANERDPLNAGPYARFGNGGDYHGADPTIPRGEPGHPIQHRLTKAIPTSQCMVCHMHQPNSFVNTYLGYQMWDYETDGELLWPEEQRYATEDAPTPFNNGDFESVWKSMMHNPEEAATRGLWSDKGFLARVWDDVNPKATETQFADYHGHGWLFRSVFSRDRAGNLVDAQGERISFDDPDKLRKAVHLRDIHSEKGMHCVDCHFNQDVHGDGYMVGEYPSVVEIRCQDCHGTVYDYAKLYTSGPAAPEPNDPKTIFPTGPDGGHDLRAGVTPWGKARLEWDGGRLIQRSMVDENLSWTVSQVRDSVTPGNPEYNEKARYAKTIQVDGETWGAIPDDRAKLAHGDDDMACFSCHTSWVTSCFGCHLPQQANWKKESNHFEGGVTRNWTSYNPQVLRQDIFMLGKHSDAKDGIIAPVRSSSALILSTVNANRERLYMQQAPVSAEGYSSQAFNTHFPHTVRKHETRGCDDCHVSKDEDNNAWLAQVYTLGTNFVNFIGRYLWVGEGSDGVEAVAVTEWDEPQAVIGSNLHKLAYPDNFARHEEHGLELAEAYHHGGDEIGCIQLRGEYLYTANGEDGLRIFDVANIDNKGFSERIVTAPVSPLGQRAYVDTEFATCVALPTNMPVAYERERRPENREQPMHPIYAYAFVTDREEGLVVASVDVLGDRDPQNNFVEREATFNPGGALDGARFITIAGTYAYVLADQGLVVVDLDRPLEPRIVATLAQGLARPSTVAIQFRYAFVTDDNGLQVLDVTDPTRPALAGSLALPEARDVYVARTYAYVAAGKSGIAIVDVTRPREPRLEMMYDAEGRLNDVHAVRVGGTVGSIFAYVADGVNGVRVLQLMAPGETPGAQGFSPKPTPRLIATRHTEGPALTLSKGMDRDRAVDESGHQVSVFGRLGSRPFTRAEMERMFLRDGEVFRVSNDPPGRAAAFRAPKATTPAEQERNEAPGRPEREQRRRRLPGRADAGAAPASEKAG